MLEIAGAEGADLYCDRIQREKLSIVETLRDMFPAVRPTLEHLLDMIPFLRPRPFSIASSLLANPGRIHLCVAIVHYTTRFKRVRGGVCSGWLSSLKAGDMVPVRVRRGLLPPPKEVSAPVLLIGPGTGIAPMRAIWQERQAVQQRSEAAGATTEVVGPTTVFFGCRHKKQDFLYGDELEALSAQQEQSGVASLAAVYCAFSRDQSKKVYVQDMLRQHQDEVWQILYNGGSVYVAGNAKMPKGVHKALCEVIMNATGESLQTAVKVLAKMERQGKYCVEAWS